MFYDDDDEYQSTDMLTGKTTENATENIYQHSTETYLQNYCMHAVKME